jgi:hypothetical protein
MLQGTVNALGAFDVRTVITMVANFGGLPIVTKSVEQVSKRKTQYKDVCSAYSHDAHFSKLWLWCFVFALPTLVTVAGILLVFTFILIVLAMIQSVNETLSRLPYGKSVIDTLPTIGLAGVVIAILCALFLIFEPRISLRWARYWLKARQSERVLAARIKQDEGGVLKVTDDNCDQLAKAIADKLEASPDWLFGTLLDDRPSDPNTLANELFFGEMFEAMMFDKFGGDWKAFRPVQGQQLNNTPISSTSNLKRVSAADFTDKLQVFFETQGIRLTQPLREALRVNTARLQSDFESEALQILSFRKPRYWMLLLSSILVLAIACALIAVRHLGYLSATAESVEFWTKILALLGSSGFVLFALREADSRWWSWLRIKLGLANRFEVVLERLKRFKVYDSRIAARRAFAKFAFEYGLLPIPPEDLKLNNASQITLVLLKTGVLWTDASSFSGEDEALSHFSDLAMRKIAGFLKTILEQRIAAGSQTFAELGLKSGADLIGEYDPYNIVDGALFLIGYDYCRSNACAESHECPFRDTGLCDALKRMQFKYDRNSNQFLLEEAV